jgi:hypothetical protein
VTDLGCAYTLEIDETGAGSIEVQSGMVELEAERGVIVVPAGASAQLLAGRRASLPLATYAGAEMRRAVTDFHAGVANARDRILAAAQPGDAITVANLVRLVRPEERRAVLERLMELSKAPQEMTVDDVEQLDLFDMWFDEIVFAYIAAH